MTNYQNIVSCNELQLAKLLAELIANILTQTNVVNADSRFMSVLTGNLHSWLKDEIVKGKYLN